MIGKREETALCQSCLAHIKAHHPRHRFFRCFPSRSHVRWSSAIGRMSRVPDNAAIQRSTFGTLFKVQPHIDIDLHFPPSSFALYTLYPTTLTAMGRIHIYYLTTFCLFWISPLTSSLPTVDPIGDDKSLQVLSVISLQPREDDESGALERRANAAIATAVPAPGQQVQNMTSTMGVNSTDPPPGFIPNSPDTYEQINCTNLRSGRDNKCWDELDLTNWVNKWIASNQCRQNEPLASCFLRKEGFYGLDCTGVKLAACTAPQSDSLDVKPEVFYVAYNIYGTRYSISRDLEEPRVDNH